MENVENNDKFLLQFLNVPGQDSSREQVEAVWAAYKNATANLERGYGCYKVEMNLTGHKKLTASRQNKHSSLQAETVTSGFGQSKRSTTQLEFNKLTSRIQGNQNTAENDLQLSNKYSQLKQK